jgi:hypothetical protein
MIGQHDASGADADSAGGRCDMLDHQRCGGARNAAHIVMLRHPETAVAPALGMLRQVAGIVERLSRCTALYDGRQVEYGEDSHADPFQNN